MVTATILHRLFKYTTIDRQKNNNFVSAMNSPTNSTGKTEHFFAIVTFLSGADTTALETMCFVLSNHHRLVSLRTCNYKIKQSDYWMPPNI